MTLFASLVRGKGVAKAEGKYKSRKLISDHVRKHIVTFVSQEEFKAYVKRELSVN
jgi:hypothetical protein